MAPATDHVFLWETHLVFFHGHSTLRLAFRIIEVGAIIKLTYSAQQEEAGDKYFFSHCGD